MSRYAKKRERGRIHKELRQATKGPKHPRLQYSLLKTRKWGQSTTSLSDKDQCEEGERSGRKIQKGRNPTLHHRRGKKEGSQGGSKFSNDEHRGGASRRGIGVRGTPKEDKAKEQDLAQHG